MPRHIKKGDSVIITAGNDKGTVGEVIRIVSGKDRVVVKGVNIRARHMKPTQANPQGGIIRREMPIHKSNVSPVVDGKPSRVRFETKKDGSKVRVAARDGSELHKLRGPKA
ncbi:MAG: 50S ribosomal protein L24 [Phycisphaerae bacterium]|jgi:large subunit ribosomal protein L24|nr:50S ribosomal protein L24 [Phycisphaerae bacterium]|tara:strand:- start:7870 stop:8202 length:333 start_codon:yes stop_codon:yes gene_type:complete